MSIDSNDPMNQFNRSFESIHWILAVNKKLCTLIWLKANDCVPLAA